MGENRGGAALTGACYCGRTQVAARVSPQVVTYCHCQSCRKVTGAPVTAWAAFGEDDVSFSPDEGGTARPNAGVSRSFCTGCGAPLAHRYDYAPGQVFVGVGLFDEAETLAPSMHAHFGSRLPWLALEDDLEKIEETSRTQLAAASNREVLQ